MKHNASLRHSPSKRHRVLAYVEARRFANAVRLASRDWARGNGDLADQARRAAQSVVLNLAEGIGHYRRGQKYRHYQIALASLNETLAALELAIDSELFASPAAAAELIEHGELVGRLCGGLARSVR